MLLYSFDKNKKTAETLSGLSATSGHEKKRVGCMTNALAQDCRKKPKEYGGIGNVRNI